MRSVKSYIDRDHLLMFLKDALIPEELNPRKLTEYEHGYTQALLDILEEVESLL